MDAAVEATQQVWAGAGVWAILWATWLAQVTVGVLNVWLFRVRMRWQREALDAESGHPRPGVVLIAPVKGTPPDFRDYLDRVLDQDHPNYRVVFTVESASDPAFAAILATIPDVVIAGAERPENLPATSLLAETGRPSVTLCVAGLAEDEGQKIHNLLAATAELTEADAVLAFIDADVRPPADWLRRLVAPITTGTHAIATTYRWLVPARPGIPNALASVINASVATLGGPDQWNLTWGGSMAIERATFTEIGLPEKWRGCLNDDVQLAWLAMRAGIPVAYVRDLFQPSVIDYTWRGLWGFVFRQYFQVRTYVPLVWAFSGVSLGLYLAGSMTAWLALLGGNGVAGGLLLTVFLLNQARADQRWRLARSLFPAHLDALRPVRVWEHFLTFGWIAFHFATVLSVTFTRRITWAGITYVVRSRQRCRVVARVSRPPEP